MSFEPFDWSSSGPARWRREDLSDEIVVVGVGGGCTSGCDTDLGEDVAHVARDGLLADHKRLRDPRFVLPLARSRRISSSRCVSPSIEDAIVGVSESSTARAAADSIAAASKSPSVAHAVGDEQTGSRGFVAHAERVELVEGSAQLDERAFGVAVGRQHRTAGPGRVGS